MCLTAPGPGWLGNNLCADALLGSWGAGRWLAVHPLGLGGEGSRCVLAPKRGLCSGCSFPQYFKNHPRPPPPGSAPLAAVPRGVEPGCRRFPRGPGGGSAPAGTGRAGAGRVLREGVRSPVGRGGIPGLVWDALRGPPSATGLVLGPPHTRQFWDLSSADARLVS